MRDSLHQRRAVPAHVFDRAVCPCISSERGELEALLQGPAPAAAASTSSPQAPSSAEQLSQEEIDTELTKISNLLDTLPASMQLLGKKWSETRCEKIASQLSSIKEILNQTSAQASTQAGWQNRLSEYNGFARDFKRIRDLPRSMNG